MSAGLFFAEIPEIDQVRDVLPVPVRHTSDGCWAVDAAGHRWFRKREDNIGYQGVLAEATSWLLCRQLGVRTPQGAVVMATGERSWLSAALGLVMHWDPAFRDMISNLDEVAAMLVLDAIVLNEDRHAGNILVEPGEDETDLRLWAIDFGDALVGQIDDFEERDLDAPAQEKIRLVHARGLPISALAALVEPAVDRATNLPQSALRTLVLHACAIARETDVKAEKLSHLLDRRCRAASQIVGCYVDRLRGLP